MSHILVVEDTPTQRFWQKILLERQAGWQVLIAENGIEAISVIEQKQVDVIVTDMLMPKMNGLELIEVVQSSFPKIPVIFVPGGGQTEVTMSAIERGVATYTSTSDINTDLVDAVGLVLDLVDSGEPSADPAKESTRYVLSNDQASLISGARSIRDTAWNMGLCSDSHRIQLAVALYYLFRDAVHFGHLELDPALRMDDRGKFEHAASIHQNREPYASRNLNIDVTLDVKNGMRIGVQHEGTPIVLPEPNEDDLWDNPPASHERTLLLLNALMDQVEYDPERRHFTLQVPIGTPAGAS